MTFIITWINLHKMKAMKKLLTIQLLLMLAVGDSCKAQTGLTAVEFEKAITGKDSVQVLDVRTPEEYNSGHIKNALLADWKTADEFNRRISFIDKDKPVYVYCLAGGRSALAAEKLRSLGYKNVYDLKGGMNAWKAAARPVEGNSNEPQMAVADFDAALKTSGTVLVDFGADWCPPCKKMEPVIASLEKNNAGKFKLLKVDGGRDQDLLKKYNVTTLPVYIVFKNGKQVWRKEGIAEEKEIAAEIN